jgi:hypothetical protein
LNTNNASQIYVATITLLDHYEHHNYLHAIAQDKDDHVAEQANLARL